MSTSKVQSPKKVQTGLRLPESLYFKLKLLAIIDGRKVNNYIEFFLRQYIEDYEREHGEITIPDEFSQKG